MNPQSCCPKCGTPVLVQVPGSQGIQGAQGATGATGPTGPGGAQGASLVWLGAWSSSTTYVENDAVYYNGSAWVALQTSTNVTPVAGAYWSLLAAQGATGSTGFPGAVTVYSVYASGTPYTLTTTSQALTFGTTSPSLALPGAGTYLLFSRMRFDGTGLTSTNQVISSVIQDTGIAAAVPNTARSFELIAYTTVTGTLAEITLPVVAYTITASTTIQLWGNLNGALGAGSMTCVEADLVAVKIA